MDQQKLRALVFEKTGVKIDIDDPIFALVALNEAVLAEAVDRHVALLDDATADLADQADALMAAGSGCRYAGSAGSERPSAISLAAPVLLENRHATIATIATIAAIAAGAAMLCALLVLTGQALFFKAPASTVIAKELTPAQAAAIEKGEKLDKIIQKLDPKTRNAIVAEMQKP